MPVRPRVLFVATLIAVQAIAPSARAQQRLALTGVTVIDVERGARLPDQTVLIDGRITRVGPSASIAVPSGVTTIDGRGKFLIPGLWDMHVHLFGNIKYPGTDSHESSFPLFIANGVTGVRDMWTDLEDLGVVREWRRESAAGRLLMPLVVPTSTPIDGPEAVARATSPKFTSPDVARRFVDSLVAGGAKIIKILNPPRDVYFAVLDQAKQRGVPVIGHVSASLHAIEASEAGLRDIEHMQAVAEGCSKREAEIDSILAGGRNPNLRLQILLESFDEATCDRVLAVFIKNRTWQTPTEALRTRELQAQDPWIMQDPHFRYAATEDTAQWRRGQVDRAAAADSVTQRLRRGMDAQRQQIIGRMYRAGVPMLIGTDLGNPFMVAGFSVHDELAITVRSGATPAQALRAATYEPARFLDATDSLGTIAAGKRADLVLLDADPLLDIANVTRIRSVIVGGKLLDRRALDALLDTAARVAPDVWTRAKARHR